MVGVDWRQATFLVITPGAGLLLLPQVGKQL